MIIWTTQGHRHDARASAQGGVFASVYEGDGWVIEFYVGPAGRYPAPLLERARAWVDRFAGAHEHQLGRLAASPGAGGPSLAQPPSAKLTPEEAARFAEFSAGYVPKRRTRKGRR
jgi:hypothetical protein